jgi:serine/threonine protein phosphatase PrpC
MADPEASSNHPFRRDEDFAGAQIVGERSQQEDCWLFCSAADAQSSTGRLLAILGDGMGAHSGGSTASYLAVHAMARAFADHGGQATRIRLATSLQKANETLGLVSARLPQDTPAMGTTLLAAWIGRQNLHWISVGDSLLMLWRDGQLRRLNADHSLSPILEDRVKQGLMTPGQAANHPRRHALQSAVMGQPITLVDAPADAITLQQGDLVILASDGLLGLSQDELCGMLGHLACKPAQTICDEVLRHLAALRLKGQDNSTLLVVRI